MGHSQPKTPINTDNKTTSDISNRTVKRKRLRAMDMRYFWIVDQVDQKQFDFQWYPASENLADYTTKYHSPKIHRHVQQY